MAKLPDDSKTTAASCYIWSVTQKITLENMGHAITKLTYNKRTCNIYGNPYKLINRKRINKTYMDTSYSLYISLYIFIGSC